MCACMASYFYSVHRHTHHKQKVVFLLGAAQFWSKFLNVFSEETAKFTVRLQKETDHAFSELSANSIFFSGAPNDNFRQNICPEDDLRSSIFGTFVVKFLGCLLLLGFSNI